MPHAHEPHDHHRDHVHIPHDFGSAFLIGIILNGGFVIAETVFGLLGNSLALLADAGHNLSDVLGLGLAWGASILAKRAPSSRFTYGLRSTSILAALSNAILLLVVTGGIAWEALLRFGEPHQVNSLTVITVAAVGVAINLATAWLFMAGRKGDLNVRAAFAHMLGDAAISVGVVVAGIAIMATGWLWLDPAVSLIIAIFVVIGTTGLLRDAINLSLHAVPESIDAKTVHAYLAALPGVSDVHDLHIWGMSTTETALTAHLVTPAGYPGDDFNKMVGTQLLERFKIAHATIQIEIEGMSHNCTLTD